MNAITGSSIAAVSNSITKNGLDNTTSAGNIICKLTIGVCAAWWGGKTIYNLSSYFEKRSIEKLKHKNRMKELERKAQLEKEKKGRKAAEKAREKDSSDAGAGPDPMRSLNDILATSGVADDSRILMYDFLTKGSTLGVCGPTNIGKSTLLFQFLTNLVIGSCEYQIASRLYPTKPQTVLLFSTEQQDEDIRSSYNALMGNYRNFKIETEGTSPDEIVAYVKEALKTATSEGIIVAIDNFTKLQDEYGVKDIKRLKRELSKLQREYQHISPITIIMVFHTDDSYREYNPVEMRHVKGSANIGNLTKNFIFLTPCRLGHEYRILKEKKNKVAGDKGTVSILKYAGSDPHQFVYDGNAVETDVLPLRPSVVTQRLQETSVAAPAKRGPKERFTQDELQAIANDLLQPGATWRSVFKSHDLPYSKSKTRTIKEAFKRHGINYRTDTD